MPWVQQQITPLRFRILYIRRRVVQPALGTYGWNLHLYSEQRRPTQ